MSENMSTDLLDILCRNNSDDKESEIETPVSGPVMTAKDGTKWA